MAEAEQGPYYEHLRHHKDVAEQNLRRHLGRPAVWAKYAWMATYHNYFCRLHERHFDDSYLIDVSTFAAQPSLIV